MDTLKTILGLSYLAILPVVFSVVFYLLDKKTPFSKIKNTYKQIIIGVVFGGLAVIGTEFGVDVGGAIANTRDASVLTAGLLFGAPAGIIAGAIGGLERFLCVYWGGGTFTRWACSLSTLISGIFGGVLRHYMFDNKKPTILYSLAIGLVAEVMHMLMIFITNMNEIEKGFELLKKCALPMISVNGLAVMLSVLAVTLLAKERLFKNARERHTISSMAQKWLLISVLSAFFITCFFSATLQFKIAENNRNELLSLNIDDVSNHILQTSDENLLELTREIAKEDIFSADLKELAVTYNVTDILYVDKDGEIIVSADESYIGTYNMNSDPQSQEFMEHIFINKEECFVQSYQPIGKDSTIKRKFAGLKYGDGFIQVGLDFNQYHQTIDTEIKIVATNRHIGKTGYIFIANEDYEIVSSPKSVEDLSLVTSLNIGVVLEEGKSFSAVFYGEEAFCEFKITEGYFIFAIYPKNEANLFRDLSIYMMIFVEVVIFVGLFILIYFLIKKTVVDNMLCVNDSLSRITDGDLNVIVNVRTNEEFASLSDDINATVETLKHYIAEASARINKELELAKVIQESTLPSTFPAFPERKDIDIYATMDAAKEVGGDFYDFYFLEDNRLAFLVADVSGKGITGAMFMMKAKTLIKALASRIGDVNEILTKANNSLCENNDAEMFVTCFMGIIDFENHKIEYANAGHNPPFIRRDNGTYEVFKVRPGFVLGGIEGLNYKKGEVEFNKGDSIFLYTDGVTEATNINNELYGEARLHEALNKYSDLDAQELCLDVKRDVDNFVDTADQFDDITMLNIRLLKDGE